MLRVEESVMINRPVAEVFAYVADMSTHPRWDAGCEEAAYASPPPIAVGTRYRRTDRMFGRRYKTTGEVTAYEPNRKITWSISGGMRGSATLICEGVGNGTNVRGSFAAEMGRLSRLAEPLLALMMRRAARTSVRNLKKQLEAAGRA